MASKLMVITLGLSLSAGACATQAGTGTAIGGAAGGALGYAVGGVPGLIVGGALGGLGGYAVGKSMDDQDKRQAAIALEQNRQMEWRNEHGDHYRIEPHNTRNIEGRECRDYKIMADIDGRPDNVTGTACRRSNGQWESIST